VTRAALVPREVSDPLEERELRAPLVHQVLQGVPALKDLLEERDPLVQMARQEEVDLLVSRDLKVSQDSRVLVAVLDLQVAQVQ